MTSLARRLGVAVLSGLGVGAAGAGPALAGGAAREVLPNGLVVLVQENPAAPVVAMTLLVRVGAAHERPETNGVTALLGRTLLKGTRARSALELAQAAEDAGGALESATDQEYSELRARGLARHWRTLLGLLHDVATTPSLRPEEIERERENLLAQLRGLEDQPFQVANRLLLRALYGDHPYGQPASGEAATVRRLTRADLVRHFEAFYTAERMVLVVSGAVPAQEVLAEAGRAFDAVPRGAAGPPLAAVPERPASARLGERRATQQAQLLLGVLAPPIGHPDYVPLKVSSAVLGAGMSSRLFRALRDEAGLAYAVGAFYPTRRETSRFVVHIGTAPANLAQAEAGIRRELARLREERVPEDELARAKTALGGGFALDLRTNARQAFYLGFFELMGAGHAFVGRYPGLIDAVTAADVQRVARRYLDAAAVVVVGPE
ncbi:MAG: insulinase family protein [Candidatus Rokubacteria bacterium]|nr:insulinase family protein [Candidatus Rokubacteria bacterium]